MPQTLSCLSCGGDLSPEDRFCAQCGAEFRSCAACGEHLLEADHSCPKCGASAIPDPQSVTGPYPDDDPESPWAEVVVRLRRATLGEFEIGRELGRGGMAAVFLAHEISLDRKVAIKVMSPGLLMGEGMIERFKREAITIAHLNHPNIVAVYSVRAAQGLHFFVMRAIHGHSLERVIHQAGKLPIPIVLSILAQVGSALAYAHRFRVVHRDIKPANILIDDEGNAVVTDFGIAKAAESPSHTHTGALVGTPAYMSPEQCNSEEVSGATDQYALGVVAYEMLTGVPPFSGSTYTVIQAHIDRPPAPIAAQVADCPPELEEAILRMLAKNPADRFPGIAQAVAALGAVPLMENDPLRATLSQLATTGLHSTLSLEPTPTSPIPHTRRSQAQSDTPPGMVRAITILPPPPALEVGDSFVLVARVLEGDAARLPRRPLEWSSDSPEVLRISATKALATAVAPGSAVITAACEGRMDRLRVDVAPARADTIAIRLPDKQVRVHEEVQLQATARDKRGQLVSRPIIWSSADDSVATVGVAGLLTPRSEGSTLITAQLDEARTSVTVTVHPAEVAALHISPPPAQVAAGDSFVLTATALDRSGSPLSDRTVVWKVSEVNVAIVTVSGWVMTLHPGVVVLTATCEAASASVTLNVVERLLAKAPTEPRAASARRASSGATAAWDLEPRAERLAPRRRSSPSRRGPLVIAGGALLLAGGFWWAGADRELPDAKVSGTPAAIQDSVSGDVYRPASGATEPAVDSGPAAQVVATGGESKDSATISVPGASADSKAPQAALRVPASITIAPQGTVRVGDTSTIAAAVLDQKGAAIRAARITWSSSLPPVVAVDARTGRLRALDSGTVLISARAGTRSATVALHVLPAAVATLSVEGGRPLKVGDTLGLRAEIRDKHGRGIGDRPVTWATSDTSIAVVEATSGIVHAQGPGSSEITATSEGVSGRVRITVLPRPRTGRAEVAQAEAGAAPPLDTSAVQQPRALEEIGAAVDRCYGAIQRKDVVQLAEMYNPVTRSDRDNLKKLSRILRTDEWDAAVDRRVDTPQQIGPASATTEFSFHLTWKDAFGGRVNSRPVFRVEYARRDNQWHMTSCRIVGSPKL